jgi:alpha-tubulin suppressor-like RCC1 family protein
VTVSVLVAACGEPRPTVAVVPKAATQPVKAPSVTPEPPRPAPKVGPKLVSGPTVCAITRGKLSCPSHHEGADPFAKSDDLFDHAVSAAKGRDFSCAALEDGHVQCAGGNTFAQLGAGIAEPEARGPTAVVGLEKVRAVRAGPFTACAIHADGGLSCWGKNQHGESGSDTQYLDDARALALPERVANVRDVVDVALTWQSGCALGATHEATCWGRDVWSRGANATRKNVRPTRAPELDGATALAANESTICALFEKELVCVGDLMMLTSRESRTGRLEVPLEGGKSLCLGANHACAVDGRGGVVCFGSGSEGQLGHPVPRGSYEAQRPMRVDGLPPVVDVACGSGVTCATTEGGETYCFGRFSYTGEESTSAATPRKMRLPE